MGVTNSTMSTNATGIGLVLLAVPTYSETFFTNKINGLAEAGHAVMLFAPGRTNPTLQCHHVRPFPMPSSPAARLLALFLFMPWILLRSPLTIREFWRAERLQGVPPLEVIKKVYAYGHIFPHKLQWLHYGFATAAIGAENVAKCLGAKLGVSVRGFDICIYPILHSNAYSLLWQRIDKLHVISDDLHRMATRFGYPSSKPVEKITPAIKVDQFIRPQNLSRAIHEPLQLITVARLHWKKGLEYALEACHLLKAKGIQFHYTIIGDGVEKEKLVYLTDQMGLNGQVTWAGKLSQPQVIKLLHQSHVYLQPSIQEGFCNSVLEAQVAELLCIVSDAEGLPENVLEGQTGWVVPRRDAGKIAARIQEILAMTPEQQGEIRLRAIQRVQEQFTLERQIAAWRQFFTTP